MSDGSNSSQKILLRPLQNIGAQDILQVGTTYEGILRKRGTNLLAHSALKRIGIGNTKWKQRFVVISQGCVYCFEDEFAKKPQCAFSLSVYNSVEEANVPGILNCFEIKLTSDANKPSQMFACETETKRQIWITHIQEAMQHVRKYFGTNCSADSDEGICMTTGDHISRQPQVPLPPTPDGTGNHKTKPAVPSKPHRLPPSEYSLESDDDVEPYDIIVDVDDIDTRRQFPGQVPVLPVVQQHSISRRPPVSIPGNNRPIVSTYVPFESSSGATHDGNSCVDSSRPNYINEVFQETEYFFDSNDRAAAQHCLENKPSGTFLVRRGNSTPTVLSVQTSSGLAGVKEFQIVEQEKKLSINKKDFFPSRDAMLCYYNSNVLPKNEYAVKLSAGYKSQ